MTTSKGFGFQRAHHTSTVEPRDVDYDEISVATVVCTILLQGRESTLLLLFRKLWTPLHLECARFENLAKSRSQS